MRREIVCFLGVLYSLFSFASETELSFYRPMTETSHHQPLTITAAKKGECMEQSVLIKREDAWRCRAEGIVYDPCFVPRFGSHLEAYCADSPWSNQGIQITVATPLDNSHHSALDMSQTFPWAIELANGKRCQAIASTDQFDGLPIRYRCDEQTTLIGHVQRCETTWKMLEHHAINGVDTVPIARAWF